VVLGLHAVEAPVVQSHRSDGDGVGDVSLACAARSEQACSCSQFGGNVEDDLIDGDELLRDAAPEPGGALDGPLALGPLRRPREQCRRGVLVHGESDWDVSLSVGFDRDRGQ
jgi:hypothetical protein